MNIAEICKKYDKGDYTYKSPVILNKVSDNHVFDENLSVKRNRELAIEHNKHVDEMHAEAQKKQNMLYWQLTDAVIKYIVENYTLTEVQARQVERFVYSEHHAFMHDYFSYIDTYAAFAEELLTVKEV